MRDKIKRIFALAVCACLLVSLAACGHEDKSEISELSAETSQEEKKQDDFARFHTHGYGNGRKRSSSRQQDTDRKGFRVYHRRTIRLAEKLDDFP